MNKEKQSTNIVLGTWVHMLFDAKSYVLNTFWQWTILPQEIQKLVDATLEKSTCIIVTFAEALYLLVGYSNQVSKPSDKSLFTECKYYCSNTQYVFCTPVQENVPNPVSSMQLVDIDQGIYYNNITCY